MRELPTISTANYTTSTGAVIGFATPLVEQRRREDFLEQLKSQAARLEGNAPRPRLQEKPVSLRIVKVIIADPNEALPLAQRLLYNGTEQATDLNDQELFFELDIKSLLDKHNAVRAATLDKKATEKRGSDVFLDPVRIRDLKMVVTTVASF